MKAARLRHHLVLGEREITYLLRRSPRWRSIGLRIDHAGLTVSVLQTLDKVVPGEWSNTTRFDDLIREVYRNPLVHVVCGATITGVSGYVGNFVTTVRSDGRSRTIRHGAAILATGWAWLDPAVSLAVRLFSDVIPGSRTTAYCDACPSPTPLPVIDAPLAFLPGLNDPWFIEQYRQSHIVVCVGQGAWEQPMLDETWHVRVHNVGGQFFLFADPHAVGRIGYQHALWRGRRHFQQVALLELHCFQQARGFEVFACHFQHVAIRVAAVNMAELCWFAPCPGLLA